MSVHSRALSTVQMNLRFTDNMHSTTSIWVYAQCIFMLVCLVYVHMVMSGADPEKWKEGWLKWCAKGVSQNFQLINYSLGHVNCFVPIHVLLQLSVFYHHHEENEASYAVWLFCSLFTLSVWLICISLYTLLTRMVCSSKSENAQRIIIMDTAYPRGGG